MAIVKMKKIRAYAMRSDKDRLLHALQLLGCAEISEPDIKPEDVRWSMLSEKETSNLSAYKTLFGRLGNAIKLLDKYAYQKTGMFSPRQEIGVSALFDAQLPERAMAFVDSIEDAESRLMKLRSEEVKKQAAIASLALWRTIDVPLEASDTQYTAVWFGSVPVSVDTDALTQELLTVTDQAEIFAAGKDREQAGLLVVFHKSFTDEVSPVLRKYGFNKVSFKEIFGSAEDNIKRIESELAAMRGEIENTLAELTELGAGRAEIKLYYDRVNQDIAAEEAKESLISSDSVFGFEGWIAASDSKAFEELMQTYPCAYELSDPQPEDQVPVKLRNNPITAPLNMVTEMYSLPSYDGIDPNPLIMPFFSVFFGIMYNDIGYGLVLIALSLLVRAKMKLRGTMKYMMGLLTLCGITSAAVGVLTGAFSEMRFRRSPEFTDMR